MKNLKNVTYVFKVIAQLLSQRNQGWPMRKMWSLSDANCMYCSGIILLLSLPIVLKNCASISWERQ